MNEVDSPSLLAGCCILFRGKLGGYTPRQADAVLQQYGATTADSLTPEVNLVVVGAEELPLDAAELLDEPTCEAAATGRLEIISETELWNRLGLVDEEQHIRRLYTPAMLAGLLHVSIATVRRWHRSGLIVPARKVHHLPYFDFQEVATARRLAQLLSAGASPQQIRKKLDELARYMPGVERPLAQLSVIVEGKQLLLRHGEGLIEPGGQLRIDFEAFERDENSPATVASPLPESASPEELLHAADLLEDEGELSAAADMCRAALAGGGPRADICFRLAELLYREGDLAAARERYYMAIEINEDYVEARANLGCVLAELGDLELAIAAFHGALRFHQDYPDVHYHLASTLDELGRREEAQQHWREFLALAPDSPWADEAQERLLLEDQVAGNSDQNEHQQGN